MLKGIGRVGTPSRAGAPTSRDLVAQRASIGRRARTDTGTIA